MPAASVSSPSFVPGPRAMLGAWLISLLKRRTAFLLPTRESRRDMTSMLTVGSWWSGTGRANALSSPHTVGSAWWTRTRPSRTGTKALPRSGSSVVSSCGRARRHQGPRHPPAVGSLQGREVRAVELHGGRAGHPPSPSLKQHWSMAGPQAHAELMSMRKAGNSSGNHTKSRTGVHQFWPCWPSPDGATVC